MHLKRVMIATCVAGVLALPGAVATNQPAIDENYVKDHSQAVEAKVDPLIEQRFAELVTTPANTSKKQFALGQIYTTGEGLVWKDRGGLETILVANADQEEGYGLSQYVVSPDGKKVAYAITYQGQDLKFWNAVKINKNPTPLLETPVENRMQGFSWSKNSDGLYYSYWHDKEDVKKGIRPILEVRHRDLITGSDQMVFSPGLAENFEIADIDGGQTLVAYRILNPDYGIKTTFSMYKGTRQDNGTYVWERAYPRNQHVAVFLGIYAGKVYLQTSAEGDTYGVSAIDVKTNSVETVVPARSDRVLHQAELASGNLILEYHSILDQTVTLQIWDLATRSTRLWNLSEFGFQPFGTLTRFKFAPGATVSRATFSDVFKGNHTLEMNLSQQSLTLIPNDSDLNFDASQVEHRLVQFEAEDGTVLSGRLYTRNGEVPSFVFMRYYGWISIKNSPEQREIQMALELGGAYFSAHLPGGGERGKDWFIDGSRNRLKMIGYINEASSFLQNHFEFGPEKIVAMGRSWGGLTSLVLAAKHGDNFGIINPVVPVIDLEDMFENGWFGRIAHSDLAPLIDENGDYIFDEAFNDYVKSISPVRVVNEISQGTRVHLFTNGLDDRVDQGGQQEAEFAWSVEQSAGSDNFHYHRSIKGNHSNRYYQVLMMSLIADHYDLEYRPLRVQ